MREPSENRAEPVMENRVAMVALNHTKDFRGKPVKKGQSFMAADATAADRLIKIGRAEIRKPKLGKRDAEPSDKSNDTKGRKRKSTGSGTA